MKWTRTPGRIIIYGGTEEEIGRILTEILFGIALEKYENDGPKTVDPKAVEIELQRNRLLADVEIYRKMISQEIAQISSMTRNPERERDDLFKRIRELEKKILVLGGGSGEPHDPIRIEESPIFARILDRIRELEQMKNVTGRVEHAKRLTLLEKRTTDTERVVRELERGPLNKKAWDDQELRIQELEDKMRAARIGADDDRKVFGERCRLLDDRIAQVHLRIDGLQETERTVKDLRGIVDGHAEHDFAAIAEESQNLREDFEKIIDWLNMDVSKIPPETMGKIPLVLKDLNLIMYRQKRDNRRFDDAKISIRSLREEIGKIQDKIDALEQKVIEDPKRHIKP